MRLTRLLAGGAAAALLTGTAACGAQALEPKIALRDAASAFTASRTGAVGLSIASSADDLRAFAEAADTSGEGMGMTDEELEHLLTSSLDVSYDLGEDRDSETDDASSVVVNVGDLVAGELRSVDELVYARVDVDGLAKKFPDMQEGLDSFRADLDGANGMEAVPAEVQAPMNALLDGEWVSVDFQAYLQQMEEMAAGQDGAGGAGMSDYMSSKARDLLGAALKDGVTAVERRETDQIGDHLVAKVDLRKAYSTLRSGLPGLLEGEQASVVEQSMPPATEIPDKKFDVSFWVRDGELKRAELDVAQFLDEPAGSFVLRADVLQDREISAPDGAVEFDLAAVMQAGMAASEADPGVAGEAPLEAVDARTVATWVDSEIAYWAQEDGAEPSVQYLSDVMPDFEGVTPGLVITAVGERVQVAVDKDAVCLTLSADGMGENIAEGPC